MKSETITIEQLFQNCRQYCVPFYQRPIVWNSDQWDPLWEDILGKAEARLAKRKPTPHFLGAVVLEPQQREGLIGVEVFYIIDGQQRLSTLQFALKALPIALSSTGNEAYAKSVIGCSLNGNTETMRVPAVEIFKVWPTFNDRTHYREAMTSANLEELSAKFKPHFTQEAKLRKNDEHPPALAAIWFFANEFRKWLSPSEGEFTSTPARAEALVLALLRDFKLVTIVLDGDDDAQIIFETLNGRGAQLEATDLIKNFVFMRADRENLDAETLYETYWSAMETDFWKEKQRRGRILKPRIEWLIHATLQAENSKDEVVDLGRLYHEYRSFANDRSASSQLATLSTYAAHYKDLVSVGGIGSTPIGRFGRQIAAFDATTIYPVALTIAASSIGSGEKATMYDDLASYLVRRSLCGLTAKAYNNVFLGTMRHLRKNGIRGVISPPRRLRGDSHRFSADVVGSLV